MSDRIRSHYFPLCVSCETEPARMVIWGARFGDQVGPHCYGCAARAHGHETLRASDQNRDGIFSLPEPDIELGRFVHCASHLRPHSTGWCSVPVTGKTPLHALDIEAAFAECRERGLKLAEG